MTSLLKYVYYHDPNKDFFFPKENLMEVDSAFHMWK